MAVTSDPRFIPSIWNWTPATATLSVEEAERVIVEETMELEVGETRVTWGGVRSAGLKAAIVAPIPVALSSDVHKGFLDRESLEIRYAEPKLASAVAEYTWSFTKLESIVKLV